MNKAIVIGCNDFAQMVRYYIENENPESVSVIAYSVEQQYIVNTVAEDGLPILPFEDIIKHADEYEFYLAIGYTKMNSIRQELFNALTKVGGRVNNYCHPSTIISPLANIGRGNLIFENVVIQPNVKIGDANIIQASCSILHHTNIGNYNFICGGSVINGVVNIGDRIFIGSNATIRNRITLESEVLVGAGAYVDHSLVRCSVVVPHKSVLLDKKSNEMKI